MSQMQILLSVDADNNWNANEDEKRWLNCSASEGVYLMAATGPTDAAHWMHMSRNHFRNAPRQEIPHDNSPIIAADSQQCAVFVERTRHRQRYAVQRAIELLRVILAKRFYSDESEMWKNVSWDLENLRNICCKHIPNSSRFILISWK